MKAYKVNKRTWAMFPIEEIEVLRMTEKSYFDHRGRSALDTDYHRVFADKIEAVAYANSIVEQALKQVRDEKARIDRMLNLIEIWEESQERKDKQ